MLACVLPTRGIATRALPLFCATSPSFLFVDVYCVSAICVCAPSLVACVVFLLVHQLEAGLPVLSDVVPSGPVIGALSAR